jgi:hypothetical protein
MRVLRGRVPWFVATSRYDGFSDLGDVAPRDEHSEALA